MTLHLLKKERGQVFADLDLTTTLLQPVRSFDPSASSSSAAAAGPPSIEVLRSEGYLAPPPSASTTTTTATHDKEEIEDNNDEASRSRYYGFNRQYTGVFTHLSGEMVVLEVLRVPDPEGTPEGMRGPLREADEAKDFDGDRYLGDLCGAEEDPVYQEAMGLTPFWEEGKEEEMEDGEKEELATLKNKEFLLRGTDEERKALGLQLLDMVLAFLYDYRTTSGDPTVESAWTLTTLSPTLSYLETYYSLDASSLPNVLQTFVRRCLTYPYLRVWALAQQCLHDAHHLVHKGGRRALLRCVLRARKILRRTETHYLLNTLFLDDWCVFLQQPAAEAVVEGLKAAWAGAGKEGGCGKEEVGLGLLELEAMLNGEEEEEEEESESEEETSSSEEEEESDSDEEESSDEEEEEEEKLVTALGEVSLQEKEHEDALSFRLATLCVDAKRQKLEVDGAVSSLLIGGAGAAAGEEGEAVPGPAAAPVRKPLIEEL